MYFVGKKGENFILLTCFPAWSIERVIGLSTGKPPSLSNLSIDINQANLVKTCQQSFVEIKAARK